MFSLFHLKNGFVT